MGSPGVDYIASVEPPKSDRVLSAGFGRFFVLHVFVELWSLSVVCAMSQACKVMIAGRSDMIAQREALSGPPSG